MEFGSKQKKIFNQKSELIKVADKSFINLSNEMKLKINEAVLAHLNEFDIQAGVIIASSHNNSQITKISTVVKNSLEGVATTSELNKYLTNFDDITSLNIKISEANLGRRIQIPISKERGIFIDQTIKQQLKPTSISNAIAPRLKQLTTNNLFGRAKFADVKKGLTEVINVEAQRYVSQISMDSINQFQGIVNDKIKRELNLKDWLYVGAISKGSRPQCIRWIQDLNGSIKERLVKEADLNALGGFKI